MFTGDIHEQEILEMDCLLDQLRATRRAKQAPLKVLLLYNGTITLKTQNPLYSNNRYSS